MKVTDIFSNKTLVLILVNMLSPCWQSILFFGLKNFHICDLHLKNIHTISALQNFLGIGSLCTPLSSVTRSFQLVSWQLQEQELLWQQQRQCQHLVRMRKGISQQQEHVNAVKPNQRSNKVKYCRPIGWGMQRGAHICQQRSAMQRGVRIMIWA